MGVDFLHSCYLLLSYTFLADALFSFSGSVVDITFKVLDGQTERGSVEAETSKSNNFQGIYRD